MRGLAGETRSSTAAAALNAKAPMTAKLGVSLGVAMTTAKITIIRTNPARVLDTSIPNDRRGPMPKMIKHCTASSRLRLLSRNR
jgi:hypothetical protein